jgi:hypothetical protein
MTTSIQEDFGRYLSSVAERDVDLLLMEEFHVSDAFVRWFSEQVGEEGALPDGAWHSLSDTDGETDLLLRVRCGNERIGILIENKVGAPEQNAQADRYHLRGIRAREAGRFDRYVTAMCAPSRYLSGLSDDSAYEFRVSYEDIAAWFARGTDKRSQWRHTIMCEAIEQGRRGYTMAVNEANSRFHHAYWSHLIRNHPQLQMAKPGNKGSKSSWIIMKCPAFPKGVKIHHKLDQQTVEIGFEQTLVDEILSVQPSWPAEIVVMQKGKTASLVMNAPRIDMSEPFEGQLAAIEEALGLAHNLAAYANLLRVT